MRLWILHLWSLVAIGLAQNTSLTQLDLLTTLLQYPELTTFTSVLNQYPQVWNQTILGNMTILAPTDDAISDYLRLSGLPHNDTSAIFEAWVTYHLLQGTHSKNQMQIATQFIPTFLTDPGYNNISGGQRVEVQSVGDQVYILSGNKSRSNIVQADILYSGPESSHYLLGFIHIIDKILTIPTNFVTTVSEAHLSGLAQVLSNAPPGPKLNDELTQPPDWTLFGPNSDGNIITTGMTAEDIYEWQAYHFVIGSILYSTDLTDGLRLQTLQGQDVTITVINGTIYVNAARIIDPDYLFTKGVIHLIDTPLNPNDTSARPTPSNNTSAVPSSSPTSGLSTGAKAGIGVGAAIGGLLLIALAIYLFLRHRRQRKRAAIPQLDSREKGGLHEVQGKALQTHPTELSGEGTFRELDSNTERSTTVHELD